MADEPTLPPLTGAPQPAPSAEGVSIARGGRAKRLRGESSRQPWSTSSDPAVFSSDDDPALDNYTHGSRRKKRYVGTWFDQQPAFSSDNSVDSGLGGDEERSTIRPPKRRVSAAKQRGQRQFKRQLDSGVWMARGDSSATDTEGFGDIEMPLGPPRLVLTGLATALRGPAYSAEERFTQTLVQKCVDEGIEGVDLR